MKKTILVLFGGCSSEYSVSLQSAHAVLTHWDAERYDLLAVGVTREGRWLRYTGDFDRLPAGDWHTDAGCTSCALRLDRGRAALLLPDGGELPFDAAFPVFHGRNGEDGTVQGLLDLAGVPVVGCGVLSSALCMDKGRAHALAALAGVRVPRSAVFSAAAPREAAAEAAEALGYPLFVKPLRAGSSFGISHVAEPAALEEALEAAFRYDSRALLEEAIPGFEVGCAVLGDPDRGPLTVGAVDEIQLSGDVFDFTEKYTLETAAIHCPARIPPETAARVQAAARAVYAALDCRVFARVDFFLTPAGEIVFNEVNTIPGLTAHSRFPSMMAAAGWDFSALLGRILELGVDM